MKKLVATAGAVMLLAVSAVSVFAADYSSQVTAGFADLTTDLTPTLAAVAVVGIGIIVLFKGLTLMFKAGRKVG